MVTLLFCKLLYTRSTSAGLNDRFGSKRKGLAVVYLLCVICKWTFSKSLM